jgi:hypothetical protein
MEKKLNQNKIGLFPNYFKKIGIVIMILAFIPVVIIVAMHIQLSQTTKELLKTATMDGFILGLLFVAWSKDKIEDEMAMYIRLKSAAWTFVFAVCYVIIYPIGNLISEGKLKNSSGQQLVVVMLFSYIIMYFLQKKSR